ncbi:MAG: hypothetical protein IT423_10390 [Pirellulaceae bacterium]|nr:hypothetical protein [Pirellulaceae bacterium]
MPNSLHLLFPLFSSLLFVVGAMTAKRATLLGAGPILVTVCANFCLALCWASVGIVRGDWLLGEFGWSALWPASWIAATFLTGQLCTFLAFRLGDVSLATPVFGVKIVLVALLSSVLAQTGVELKIWCAAGLATLGVVIIPLGADSVATAKLSTRRAAWAVGLALLAATSLSFFDIGVQAYGPRYGAIRFLTTMFVIVGLLSIGLLPWAGGLEQLPRPAFLRPLIIAAALMSLQAISITYSLAQYGDATRVNIVYSLRGLWSVLFAWGLSRLAISPETHSSPRALMFRLAGAILLMISVVVALSAY